MWVIVGIVIAVIGLVVIASFMASVGFVGAIATKAVGELTGKNSSEELSDIARRAHTPSAKQAKERAIRERMEQLRDKTEQEKARELEKFERWRQDFRRSQVEMLSQSYRGKMLEREIAETEDLITLNRDVLETALARLKEEESQTALTEYQLD